MTDIDEPGLRGGLRELADRDATGPVPVADLLGRARRRRQRFVGYRAAGVAATAVCAVGAVVTVGAMWGGSSSKTSTGSSGSLAQQTCSATWLEPNALPTGHPGADRALLPGDPAIGLACQYSANRLVGSVPLEGARLAAVTKALHQPVAPAAFRCPAPTTRGGVILEFRYGEETAAPDVYVELSTQCPGLANGALSQIAFNSAGTLPATLTDLLPATK